MDMWSLAAVTSLSSLPVRKFSNMQENVYFKQAIRKAKFFP